MDSVGALIKIREKKNAHIAPSTLAGDGDRVESVAEKDSTTNLIVSKDYYDRFDSSDDSFDESIKPTDNLASEISRSSDSECDDLETEREHDQQLLHQENKLKENSYDEDTDRRIDADLSTENNDNLVDKKSLELLDDIKLIDGAKRINEKIHFETHDYYGLQKLCSKSSTGEAIKDTENVIASELINADCKLLNLKTNDTNINTNFDDNRIDNFKNNCLSVQDKCRQHADDDSINITSKNNDCFCDNNSFENRNTNENLYDDNSADLVQNEKYLKALCTEDWHNLDVESELDDELNLSKF